MHSLRKKTVPRFKASNITRRLSPGDSRYISPAFSIRHLCSAIMGFHISKSRCLLLAAISKERESRHAVTLALAARRVFCASNCAVQTLTKTAVSLHPNLVLLGRDPRPIKTREPYRKGTEPQRPPNSVAELPADDRFDKCEEA